MLKCRISACACAFVAWIAAAAAAQPLLAQGGLDWLPIGIVVEPVGNGMRINGLATEVVRLRGAVTADELRAAFQAQDSPAARKQLPPVEQLDGWELLSRPEGRGFQTLQLRSDARGDVDALFSRTDLGDLRRSQPSPPLRLPADARVTSIVESADAGTRSTQFVAWSALPAERARRQICQRAIADGWRAPDCQSSHVSLERDTQIVSMGVAKANLPATHGGALRSVIVLNLVEQGQ